MRGPTNTHPVPTFSPKCSQRGGSFVPFSPPQERAVSRRRRETSKCASALNARMIFGTAATTAAQNSGERTANHFAVFVPQPFRAIDKLAVGGISRSVRTYTISTSFRLCAVCDAVKTADNRQKNPPVSGGRQSQFPDDDSYFEVLLCPLNLPQEHRKNNSDDGTGCVIV